MVSSSPLQFHNVSKVFPRGKGTVRALAGLELELAAGKVTGLLGPDGAGKTTLIRLATGLLQPSEGKILRFGEELGGQTGAQQQRIGYMPQRFGLYEDLTVQENLDLYSDLQGIDTATARQRQAELLQLTALGPFGKRRAGALSGGMKQKLGLACALLRAPDLLLLDEPTVGVDPIARRELWSIIQGLRGQGTTVLLSTAYFDEAERCDEILLLHEGQLLREGTPQDFLAPFDGHCFLVTAAGLRRRALRQALQARAGIVDARVVAGGVRVLCSEPSPLPMAGEEWKAIPPSFEDAFVSLLGSATTPAVAAQGAETVSQPSGAGAEEIVIRVEGLRKVFGSFEAVKSSSFQVRNGEIFGLLGANGAGKTTTFRMLCGLLAPSGGTLEVAGVDMRRASSQARARIGYVAQKFALYGNLSVDQNLQFFASAYGLRAKTRSDGIARARRDFQLDDYRDINVDDLPLGIKQRLALACALLHQPPILFLDEPTSGVDPLTRREFWQRINALAASGVTVLITTHFMDEAEYCDRLILQSLGEILAQGSPEEIRRQAQSPEQPNPSMEDAFIHLIESHEQSIRRAS
ncbi:ATP-binding cassette domain-containing protein [Acidithiobacillus sp. AMEEHan]|uniref:ATP-binding cassette domain-containing protein n=1 Tax=Acidithiobacillus sp. AMEEHan TaxID=2994951 RepID=UPI0027E58598|nr:ATP-binding cassette domain-containing protein [Acidithiobacillus sp. AMEEHan]